MRLRGWLSFVGFILVVATVAAGESEPGESLDDLDEGRFVYFRSDGRVELEASSWYAVSLAPRTADRGVRVTPPDGLEFDPRSLRPDLIERGLSLFRVPDVVAPRGIETPPPNAWLATLGSGLPAQPVFEQGAALRIPSDEVVVAFAPTTTREEAMRLLAGVTEELDAERFEELRPGRFVAVLKNATAGRAFEVSRLLSDVEGVFWAEPSFINLFLQTPGGPPVTPSLTTGPELFTHVQMLEAKAGGGAPLGREREPEEDWRLVLDAHFESAVEEWTVARDIGSNRVLPLISRDRAHGGNRSVYMSGKGLAGNRPQDPYADGASAYLSSPIFTLVNYSDVFVELYVHARFERPQERPPRIFDFGRVLLYEPATGEFVQQYPIAPVIPTGDYGWRKLLFRVPLENRRGAFQLIVHFFSDGTGGAGGLFVDDIRVLGTYGSDTSFSEDPAASGQYAVTPRGQIGGRPTADDPVADAAAAWSLGHSKNDVIVALLDDGVERGHPDLVYWEPEKKEEGDPEEVVVLLDKGEPVAPADRHGTACAGVLGAVADNGVGIAGVAPGASLLPLLRGLDDLSIVRAIDTAVEVGARVLVLPWGWSGAEPEAITEAIAEAIDAGTVVVAAAGDGVHRPYGDAIDYPCLLTASTSLICVGASSIDGGPKGRTSADGLYWWSSAADHTGPDVLAPGTWLHATDRHGALGYNDGSESVPFDWTDSFAGTGGSACYAGGVAALMASRDPELSPGEVKRLIAATATDLPPSEESPRRFRLVSPADAVLAAIELEQIRARTRQAADQELPEAGGRRP